MLTSVSFVAAIAMNVRSRSSGPVLAPLPLDRALGGELLQRLDRLGRDEHDLRVAGQQALDLLEPDVAAADDDAAPPGQLQAGDVERRLEHALHARLVADPLAELADALLAGVGLGGHAIQGSGTARTSVRRMAPDGYFTDDSMLRRVVGDRVTASPGPRALLVMAAHPVAFAGFFAHTGALDDPYARLSAPRR